MIRDRSTTDLESLKIGKPFTWGKVIKIMEIEQYSVAEFHPFIYEGNFGTNKINYNKKEYYCWLSGKPTSRTYESLQSALAGLISEEIEGPNHRADVYFIGSLKHIKEQIS